MVGTGCSTTPAVTVIRGDGTENGQGIQGDPLKIRRTAQEGYAGLRGGFFVVRNHEDWQSVWPSGQEGAMPTTLDTSKAMLLMASSDSKDTVQMHINRVLETASTVHVWVRETKNGTGCTPKLERTPYDAVIVHRIDKPVRFYVDEDQAESCGDPPTASVKCRLGEAPTWSSKLQAQPGEVIDCEATAEAHGRFALTDRTLTVGSLPGGSGAKLAYTKGPTRGTITPDVFGTYNIQAEATDDAGRKGLATAQVEVLPPKTRDVLVELIWQNFDVSDDPDTFPRVKLRATSPGPRPRTCALDSAAPELCEVKTRSAYVHMKLKAGDKKIPLSVQYVDERVEKGPMVCVQLYFDGARTSETCDRPHRNADERWDVGTVDLATGKLIELEGASKPDGGAPESADAGPAPETKTATP